MITPKLIVGLGNPDPKYHQTRHNIGFNVLDKLATSWEKNNECRGLINTSSKVFLLKPLTYMNNSGQSVKAIMNKYQIPIESILVVYDDVSLPLGKLRMRLAGSDGGHNGVKSIISNLGTNKFPRLKIGIGKAEDKEDLISFVLGRFSSEEIPIVEEVVRLAVEAVQLSLFQGIEKAMNRYNKG